MDCGTNRRVDPPPIHPLPTLADNPTIYSGCCLALSKPLVTYLRSLLPPPPCFALSVGSGFGLLEALLIAEPHSRDVIGVEVEPSSNKYLPATHHRVVHGSRFLEPLAAEAATWLFVYPRRVGLVEEYLSRYGLTRVERVIWVGPKVDWADYEACFAARWELSVHSADEVGGRVWELIAVANLNPDQGNL